MAEVAKPPVTIDPVAPTTATEVPLEAAGPTNEQPSAITETPAALATEDKKDETAKPAEESKETPAPKEEVKPIYEGVLRYTPTGNPFKSIFGLKEKLIFFYGEEAVPADKLAHLVKPGKSELKETVAWSSQTGKGLLYFVKHADQKTNPKGVISLADVEEPKAVGSIEINFKLNGHQHDLLAESKAVRDGWLLSLKEKIEEAKGLKEEITGKEGYKEQLEKLTSKPAPVAAVIAKTEGSPKKSTDERAPRSEASKANPTKDRSQSRGKKVLAALRGKKEGDAAKEESKAEKAEEGKLSTETPAVEAVAPITTEAPATSTETPAAAEGTATDATPTAATGEAETKAEEAKEEPKKERPRRTSKLFASFKGALSPSQEKKQGDLIPPSETAEPTAVPETSALESAKEAEPAAEAAPATEAAAVAPVSIGDKVEKPEEVPSPTTAAAPSKDERPAKDERRRSSFFGDVQSKLGAFRSKSQKNTKDVKDEVKPSGEESKAEEPAVAAAPTIPDAAVIPAPAVIPSAPAVEESKAEEPKTESAKPVETTEATEAAETPSKEPETKPKKENKLFSGVTRSLSKAFRGDKTKKEKVNTPEKVAETEQEETKPAEEAKTAEPANEAEVPKKEAAKKEESAAPNSIGDVVPEAVNVGTAPKPSATVQATA